MPVLLPDLVYNGGAFRRGLGIEIEAATGRIGRVGDARELERAARERGDVVETLPGRALVPGFVNAHSHAFQRLIRGRTQWRSAAEPQADFWSWREAMYGAALALSPEDVYHASRFCFLEMLRAGFTSVGEFHYLHRDPAGEAYADPNELALRVIAAAEDVGIRIVLLKTCYAAGGIGRPLEPQQRRFATPDLDAFLAETEQLAQRYADHSSGHPLVTVGVAPHSVRAVPRGWLAPLRRWAAERGAPFHIHVAEQPAEVEACRAAYGLRPVELLAEEGVVDDGLTAIHATHLAADEIALLGDAGATVCACPTTERDLGDGFLPGAELLGAGAHVALGTDSHTVIDPFEEMRLVEYHERLRRLRRVVLAVPGKDGRLEVAPLLFELATESGARALRIDAGRLAPGALADIVAIDLEHPALAGWTDDSLASLLALCAPASVVSDVWVGGVRRIEQRRHVLDDDAAATFRRVAERLG
nr:MAG: formimidoylglutamate deiminase [bacterium]